VAIGARGHGRLRTVVHGGVATALLVLLQCLTPALSQQPTKHYTPEQIEQMTPAQALDLLVRPDPDYGANNTRAAVVAKAKQLDAAGREWVIRELVAIAQDRTAAVSVRSQACHALREIDEARGVDELAIVLMRDPMATMRAIAASALGWSDLPAARAALETARQRERNDYTLEWIDKALARIEERQRNVPQNTVSFLVCKDWIRVRNTGGLATKVEFHQYFPIVDDEQLVLGRWVTAQNDDDLAFPVSVVKVEPDAEGNLIHRFCLECFPEHSEMTVTITTILAFHAKPPVTGPRALLPAEAYPPAVRPYLSSTAMAPLDDPVVQRKAREISATGTDALDLTRRVLAYMKTLPYTPTEKWTDHPELSRRAFTLTYGNSCCLSAAAACTVLRACGIPTQLTYTALTGQLHGIIQAWFDGYGWARFDATCGFAYTAPTGYVFPRLFNMPLSMEQYPKAELYPYYYIDMNGPYQFTAQGQPAPAIQMCVRFRDGNAKIPGAWEHYEPGNASHSLGSVPYAGPWLQWDQLAALSKQAILSLQVGEFVELTRWLPEAHPLIEKGLNYQEAAGTR
ncbi:MAG: HEAT repeat domain-containing protein, partial [Armatimonadetes bacterium]|nr:HEAT repeat domain-containing protein [Armatimonadota bacterium]